MKEIIDDKIFGRMTLDNKLKVLYNCICNVECKMEKHKIRISMFSLAGGIIGGFIAIMSRWTFWGK